MSVCSTYGIDICPYESDSFNEGDTINVGVYCEKECEYKVEFRYASET